MSVDDRKTAEPIDDVPRAGIDRAAPITQLLAYSLPAIGLAMLSGPIVVFLPNFYATEANLSLAVVGAIFFAARIWDGASDLIVGLMSDRTNTRWGKRIPWLVAATPVLCLAVYVLLLPPKGVGPLYLFVGLIAVYTAWTAVQVPYTAWGTAISTSYVERNRIFGLREAGTVLGSLGTVLLPFAFTGIPSPPLPDVLRILGLSVIAIMLIAIPVAIVFGPAGNNEAPQRGSLWRAVVELRDNGPFVHVLAISFLATTALLIFTAGILFYLNLALQLQAVFLQLLLIQQVATILSVPGVLAIAARFGRHRALSLGCFGAAAGFLAMCALPSGNFAMTAAVLILIGCSAGALFVLVPAMAADAIDYGILRRLGAQNGLYMSVLSLVTKLGTALAVGLALPLLQTRGFDPNNPLTAQGRIALVQVTLILPALIIFISGLLAWRHPIDRRRHELIVRRLKLVSARNGERRHAA